MRRWGFVGAVILFGHTLWGQPSIDSHGVVNATGYQNKLAPGAVFAAFGHNLGPASIVVASAPNYPDSLAGTSITFTPAGGGAPVTAKMVYTLASQVAGFLPSSVPPGDYEVRVTYNGQISPPETVTVVARSFGIATANGGGTGPAQATNGSINNGLSLVRFTSGALDFGGYHWILSPAHPNDVLVLWGTGGGADLANDAGGSSGDQTAGGNFKVLVGGRQITPLYAGATPGGLPGLWQINYKLPGDIMPDCFTPVQVSAGGELSNPVTIAISASGQAACSDPNLSEAVLTRMDAGGDLTVAAFGIYRVRETATSAAVEGGSGFVARYKAAKFALSFSGPRFGPCVVYDRTYPVGGLDPASPEALLDAGATLPLSGPNLPQGAGLGRGAGPMGPYYFFLPASGTFAAGTYTLTGTGGTQVGAFSVSTVFPASFTVTNWDSVTSIDRTKPLTFNWTGAGLDQVYLLANTATTTGSNIHIVTITCTVPGTAGTYSIPPAALAYLQPAATTGASYGSVSVQGISASGTFTAPLAEGGHTDIGAFGANLGVSKNIAVQ